MRWAPVTGLAVVAYLLLANQGRHHWHEFRDLYSGTFYSTAALMQGAFDPGPSPVRAPTEVATWYANKLLHVFLLGQLSHVLGPSLESLNALQALYAGMLASTAAFVGLALRRLAMPPPRAWLTAGVFLLGPVGVYLGFKLMGEVPSMFFAAGGLALFAAGLWQPSGYVLVTAGSAGLALGLSALCGWTGPALFLGFWLALPMGGVPRHLARRVLFAGFVALLVCTVAMSVGLALLGGSPERYVAGLAAMMEFTKPLPMGVFALASFALAGAGLWIILPLVFLSGDAAARRFFATWLLLSTVPALVFGAGFLEPRYLVAATVPFAGLIALGVETAWRRLLVNGRRSALSGWLLGSGGVLLLAGSAAAQPFMPYEAQANDLVALVQAETTSDDVAVLLPWSYSDFHLLRFVFPDKPVYLVQSARTESGQPVDDQIWTDQYRRLYGARYIPDARALATITQHRLLYVGWTILPSLHNAAQLLEELGLGGYSELLLGAGVRDHLSESWLWSDPAFRLSYVIQREQYMVYEVNPIT
jgi:hypothetical protein